MLGVTIVHIAFDHQHVDVDTKHADTGESNSAFSNLLDPHGVIGWCPEERSAVC